MSDKYLTYTVEDWLTDDDFIMHLEGQESALSELMHEFASHSDQASNIEEAKKLFFGMRNTAIKVPTDKLDLVFENINDKIDNKLNQAKKKSTNIYLIRTLWVSGVAAAILLLVIFNPFSNGSLELYATHISDQKTINLPDNSVVELNNVSKLKFDRKRWEQDRSLELEGEAFFKVEKGSKFTVKSSQGSVSVLGTQFNIYDREGTYEVECIEGKVEVVLKNGEKHILEAGDKLSSKQGQKAIKEEKVIEQIDWLNEYVEINEMPLKKVLEELSRYYEIQIVNEDKLKDIPYTGYFSTEILDSAIYQIFWPLDINYTIDGNKIIIE